MSHRLVVVRHAKAEPHAATDHARNLTVTGRQAAANVGRWLATQSLAPNYGLVSTATRTRQTWSEIHEQLPRSAHVEFSDGLYHAGPSDVVDAIRWVPVDTETVIYVGHNPTAGELPHLLDDGSGPAALLDQVAYGFPTAAAAVFDVPCPWSDLGFGRARLTDVFVGERS